MLPQRIGVRLRRYCPNTPACCHIIHLQCSLSDGVLAWRCYVIFGKRLWLKWTLTIVVLVITSMCYMYLLVQANFCTIVSGMFPSILNLFYGWESIDGQPARARTLEQLLSLMQFPSTLTWAVCSLGLNTALSTSIIVKIV
jgi:hypothetical protein